jgi:hypothetical protein
MEFFKTNVAHFKNIVHFQSKNHKKKHHSNDGAFLINLTLNYEKKLNRKAP